MASTPPRLLRLQIAILLGLLSLSLSANARPCRTYVISSYFISFRHPSYANGHYHGLPADQDSSSSSSGTFTTFTEIRPLIPAYIVSNGNNDNEKPSFATAIYFDRTLPRHPVKEEVAIEREASQIPRSFGFSSYEFNSLRDRTKDILSVVVALLFGVGCGALTAATMYLVWSVFYNRYEYRASYDDYVDDDDNGDEIESPKKMGYVKIPTAESVPAPAKESV